MLRAVAAIRRGNRFLCGRYPRTLGVTLLQTPLPEGEQTLAMLLRAADYDTAAIGKMHFNSNLAHGFALRIDLPQHARHLQEHPPKPLPKDIEVQPPWRPFRDPARIWLNSACRPFAARDEDMAGTFLARQAVRYLHERRDKPFFLMVKLDALIVAEVLPYVDKVAAKLARHERCLQAGLFGDDKESA